jgi:hypothetical protein
MLLDNVLHFFNIFGGRYELLLGVSNVQTKMTRDVIILLVTITKPLIIKKPAAAAIFGHVFRGIDLKFGQDTGFPVGFHGLLQSFYANSRTVPSLHHDFLHYGSVFIQEIIHLTHIWIQNSL